MRNNKCKGQTRVFFKNSGPHQRGLARKKFITEAHYVDTRSFAHSQTLQASISVLRLRFLVEILTVLVIKADNARRQDPPLHFGIPSRFLDVID